MVNFPNELECRSKVIRTIRSCTHEKHLNSIVKMIDLYHTLFPNRGILDQLNKMLDRQQKVWILKNQD